MKRELSRTTAIWIVVALVAVLIGNFGSFVIVSLVVTIAISATSAMSLTVLQGWAGQASLFVGGIMLVGGYLAAWIPQHGPPSLSIIYTLIAGGAVGIGFGVLSSLPSKRLSGLYLLLSTLGYQYIVYYAADQLQSSTGNIGGFATNANTMLTPATWMYISLALMTATLVYYRWLRRGRIGRAAILLRTDRGLADVAGLPSTRYLVAIFAVTAAFMAMAGVVDGFYTETVSYDGYSILFSVTFFVMMVIGGVDSLWGAIFGAFFVEALTQLVQNLFFAGGAISTNAAYLLQLGYAVVGFGSLMLLRQRQRWLGALVRGIDRLIHRNTAVAGGQPSATGKVVSPVAAGVSLGSQDQNACVIAHNVSVVYGATVRGLQDAEFSVSKGEILALVGRNGAGKSSLLYSVAGFPIQSDGRVSAGSRIELVTGSKRTDITRLRAHERANLRVSMVPADEKVFAELTVDEHLRMLIGRSRELTERVKSLRSSFPDLDGKDRLRAGVLSGGQRQQLALLCALAHRPHVLLVDELSLGLSPIATERLVEIVKEVQRQQQLTMIVAEQNVGVSFAIADRVALLEDGRILRCDAPTPQFMADVERAYIGLGGEDDSQPPPGVPVSNGPSTAGDER